MRTRPAGAVFPLIQLLFVVWLFPFLCAEASVHYAVIAELSRDRFTSSSLESAAKNYVAKHSAEGGMQGMMGESLQVINSKGSLLSTLSELDSLLANASLNIGAVLIADSPLITEGVVEYMSQTTSNSIPIISLLAGGDELCEVKRNPQVVCLGLSDNTVIQALLETAHAALSWEGISTILSNNIHGRRMQQLLSTEMALENSPIIVKTELFSSSGTSDEDLTFVGLLTNDKETGVACFLTAEEITRLMNAYDRKKTMDNTTKKMFFIGYYMGLNALDTISGQSGAESLLGALFVPHYRTAAQLKSDKIVDSSAEMDELGAYIVSYLCDALQMMANTGTTNLNAGSLRGVNFTGLTGQVVFETVRKQRSGVAMHLITQAYPVSSPLITFTFSQTSSSIVQKLQSDYISKNIPLSPLWSVTVCLAFPPNCADVAQAMSVYYTILLQVIPVPGNTLFRAINTGNIGVDGFASLVAASSQCTFLVGSGHALIDSSMGPIVSNFKTTQIDYQAASSLLTSSVNPLIPTFSRTIPEYSLSESGFAEVCSHFGWERVIVITSSDTFGKERATVAVAAMVSRNIYVEKQYSLADTSRSSILATLQTIYEKDVSRIIFFAVPLFGDDAKTFFDLIDTADFLHNYVFLLDHNICAYGASNPGSRKKLQSSICMSPQLDLISLEEVNGEILLYHLEAQATVLLAENGFLEQSQTCDYSAIPETSGFALDAGLLVLNATSNAAAAGVSFFNSSAMLPFVRNNSFVGFTGSYTIDAIGNRNVATFYLNIQTQDKTIVFGIWSQTQKPNFQTVSTDSWLWMTNKTTVPLDTFRDPSFVFQSTALSSPGVIAISVLGFVITIFAFLLCYRHFHIQRKIEDILESNTMPITDTELKHLRGMREEHY